MKALARFVIGMFILSIFGLVGAMLFAVNAKAQTNLPPAPFSQWVGVVQNISMNDKQGCVAGWFRADRFDDYRLQGAFIDGSRLTGPQQTGLSKALTTQSMPDLLAMRNVNLTVDEPVLRPCLDKITAPAAPWIVAPTSTGKRPAYLLLADGKRGAQSGTADTTIEGQPMWCSCRIRSIETTSSNYCSWATMRQTFEDPKRVTLCREVK